MLHGTARGKFNCPWPRSPHCRVAFLVCFETRFTRKAGAAFHHKPPGDEFEGIAVALDVAGVEMPADHQRRRVGKAREQFAPRHRRLNRVGIGGRRPVEMGHLAGMVGDVAGQQALFAVRLDVQAHMAGAVAGRRDQGDFVADPGRRWRPGRPCRHRRSASRNR
jgi:hypothetical protein